MTKTQISSIHRKSQKLYDYFTIIKIIDSLLIWTLSTEGREDDTSQIYGCNLQDGTLFWTKNIHISWTAEKLELTGNLSSNIEAESTCIFMNCYRFDSIVIRFTQFSNAVHLH